MITRNCIRIKKLNLSFFFQQKKQQQKKSIQTLVSEIILRQILYNFFLLCTQFLIHKFGVYNLNNVSFYCMYICIHADERSFPLQYEPISLLSFISKLFDQKSLNCVNGKNIGRDKEYILHSASSTADILTLLTHYVSTRLMYMTS